MERRNQWESEKLDWAGS